MSLTSNFILKALGLPINDAAFVDEMIDNFDIECDSDDVYEALDYARNTGNTPNGVDYSNFGSTLIAVLWDKVVSTYVDKGLDEDAFDCDINALATTFYYDGEPVYSSEDLDALVEDEDEDDY